MSQQLALSLVAAAIPLALTLDAQTAPSSPINVSFNVNHATACPVDGNGACLSTSDSTSKLYSVKVQSTGGANAVFLITDSHYSAPITATVTIAAPTQTFPGAEVQGPTLAFFVPYTPPGADPIAMVFTSTSVKSVPSTHVAVQFDCYFNATLNFGLSQCPVSANEFALPISTADQRHEPAGGPRLLTLTGLINFEDTRYAFTVFYDYAALDRIGMVPYPPGGSTVTASIPPFYALIPYDLETSNIGEIHLELQDAQGNLLAASPSRRFCVARDPACDAQGHLLPHAGQLGEGTAFDPFVFIGQGDYLSVRIPDTSQIVTLKAVLVNPKNGNTLASSAVANYNVAPAPTPIVEIGTLDSTGAFIPQSPGDLSNPQTFGLRLFSTGFSNVKGGDQLHAAIKNTKLQPGESLKLDLCYQEQIRDPHANTWGPLVLLTRKTLFGDGELLHAPKSLLLGPSASGIQFVTRVILPDGTQLLSPPLQFWGSYIDTPASFTFAKDRMLSKGTDEAFSIPVEASLDNDIFATNQTEFPFYRCDVFILKDKTEVPSPCVQEKPKIPNPFGSVMDNFSVHILQDSDLSKPGAVDQYCFYFKLYGYGEPLNSYQYATSPRFCNAVQTPQVITSVVTWADAQLKNVKNHLGEKIVKTGVQSFLDGAANPLIHAPTDGKKSGANPLPPQSRGSSVARAAVVAPPSLPDFLGLRGTTQFTPSFASGTFSADLTLSYSPADFPDDPQFDPSKIQIVAIDPVAGKFNPLQSTVDTTAQTVTAHIDGLAPIYGMAQFGPFANRNSGAAALTAGGADNAGMVAVNAGTSGTLEIDVYGATPSTASPGINSGQVLKGFVNQLVPGEAGASWLLTRAPPAIIQTQLLASGRGFDLLDPQRALSYAIFPAVEQNILVSTEFHIANPNAFSSTASIFLIGPDGTLVDSLQFQIDPKDRKIFQFASAFSAAQTPFTGYVLLSADQKLNASAVVSSGAALAAYNAAGTSVTPSHIVVPYLGPDAANLYLVNTGTSDVHFTATAYDQTGATVGTPVTQTIPAQQQYSSALVDMFAPPGALPRGSVAIDVDSQNIAGEIVFHANVWQKLAAIPVGGDAQTSVLIPYQASDSSSSTTVNIAGTGTAAKAAVTVFGLDGSQVGSGQVQVPPNGSASGQISSLVPAASGLTGGYLRIGSDQPVVAYAELTSTATTDFAVVAAQPAAGSPSAGPATPSSLQLLTGSPEAPITSYDFGTVAANQTKDVSIKLLNNGSAGGNFSLSIDNPRFIVSTGTLGAGSNGGYNTFSIRFAPTDASAQSGTLTVTGFGQTVTLSLKGNSGGGGGGTATISITVPATDFGTVNTGSTKDIAVTIASVGTRFLSVTPSISPNPPFSIVGSPAALSINAGTSQTLTVRFSPTSAGSQTGTLTLVTDDLAHPTLAYQFTGNGGGTATISVTVPATDFGTVNTGSTKDIALTIASTGTRFLSVTPSVSPNPPFSIVGSPAALSINAGTSQTLTVRFSPTSAGSQTGTLTLVTDDLAHPTLTYQFTGTGAAQPSLQLLTGSPGAAITSYDFGTVAANQVKDGFFQLLNTGSVGGNFSLSIDNPRFILSTGTLGAGPNGGYNTFSIRFAPTDASAQTGTLTVTGLGQTATLSLKGNSGGGGGSCSGITFNTTLTVTGSGASASGNTSVTGTLTLSVIGTGSFSSNFSLASAVSGSVPVTFTVSSGSPTGTLTGTLTGSPLLLAQVIAGNPASSGPATITISTGSGGFAGATGTFNVTASGTGAGTTGSGAGSFKLSGPGTIKIPGSNCGSGTPTISVSVPATDFGTVNTGATQDLPVTIASTGTSTLSVTPTIAPNPPFSIVGAPAAMSINAGTSQTLTIRFSPTAAGVQTGTLNLVTDDQAHKNLSFQFTGTGTATPACLTVPANIVSWWPADGNASDIKGGNNGTLQSGGSYAAGEVAQAFSFDGVNGYVRVGDPGSLRLTSAFTIEGWIYPRALASGNGSMSAIITKWAQNFNVASDADSWGFWLRNNNGSGSLFSGIHVNSGGEPNISGGSVPLNTWSHVAVTFNSATAQHFIYLNGQVVASGTPSAPLLATSRNVLIGREDSSAPRPFNGLIDELSVYSRALTSAEISSIYQAGALGKCKR